MKHLIIRNHKLILLALVITIFSGSVYAQLTEYETLINVHYYDDSTNHSDTYIDERCVLDIYYPKDAKDFATVVWFHGGGLTGGNKSIPLALKEKGIGIVAVNYRLFPKVKAPVYIEDAAAAVSWVFNNIRDYGGDPSLIFLSGHSAAVI